MALVYDSEIAALHTLGQPTGPDDHTWWRHFYLGCALRVW